MRWIIPVRSQTSWERILSIGLDKVSSDRIEFILEPTLLSRRGQLTSDQVTSIFEHLNSTGHYKVLAWDDLATQKRFLDQQKAFEAFRSMNWDAIRVQDSGVFNFVAPSFPVHLILETGHHNLTGVEALLTYGGQRIKRLVLSNEVPMSTIQAWKENITCPIECQVFGEVLIFFSPRPLLTDRAELSEELDTMGISNEDQRSFHFVQNEQGTFMYLDKWLFLLDRVDSLEQAGYECGRVQIDGIPSDMKLEDWILPLVEDHRGHPIFKFKKSIEKPLTKGFFSANKTDRQFVRLKNRALRESAAFCRAKVLQNVKKKYLVVEVSEPLEVGHQYQLLTPEGKKTFCEFQWLQKPWKEKTNQTDSPGVWLVSHVPGISSGSLVLDCDPTSGV